MKLDVLSNYIFRGISIIISFFLIPITIKYLGLAAYGLIGFFGSIQAVMVFFDFGMGVNSNRILAEETGKISDQTRRVLKSVELIYLVCAFSLGMVIIIFAHQIADTWLHINDDSLNGTNIIRLMGVLFIVTWPKSLYMGFLTGQKKILLMNSISITFIIVQSLMIILIITKWVSTLNAYLCILILIGFLDTLFLRYFGTRSLVPQKQYASRAELKHFYYYSAGIGIFSVLSLVIFQFDRFYISRFFPIASLGTYNLAAVIPFSLLTLIYPITAASFPRFVNIKNSVKAKNSFIEWSTIIFLLSGVFFAVCALNLSEIYLLWLKESNAHLNKVSLYLLIAVSIHVCTNMIVNVLLANGKAKVVWVTYFASIIVYFSFIALSIDINIELLAKAWIILNICLLSCLLAGLFYFDEYLGNKYFTRLFMVICTVGSLIVLLKAIEYFNIFLQNNFLKLILYLVVFGTYFLCAAGYLFKKQMQD